jgi:two-component system NarL family response regulator
MSHPSSSPIRVMVVDDQPMMREGISAALLAQGGIEIVCTAANGSEAIADFARHRPDVSLVDLQMPVKDGLEAIVGIRALHPDARIVVLTTYRGDARVVAALKAGAAAYLLKDASGAALAQAVRNVYQGASVIAPLAQHDVEFARRQRPHPCGDARTQARLHQPVRTAMHPRIHSRIDSRIRSYS